MLAAGGCALDSVPNATGIVLLPLTLAWLVWLALAAARGWRLRRQLELRDQLAVGALFLGALALRLAAPAMPHDINPRWDDMFAPWTQLGWRYTHGLVALFRALWVLGALVDDRVVFAVVAVAGALSAPLVYAVTCGLGGGRVAAGVAGIVLGGLGLHVRYSHTDAPQIVEGLLTLVAVATVLHTRDGPRTRDVVWVGLSVGLAMVMRPEGVVLPVLLALWAAAGGLSWPGRAVLVAGGIAAVVGLPDVAGVILLDGGPGARGAGLSEGHGLWVYGPRHLAPFNDAFVPTALGALTLLAPWGRAGHRRGLATFALMVVAGALVANHLWSIGHTPSWCLARHQLRVVPWMAVLVGLGTEAVVDRVTTRAPVVLAGWVPALVLAAVANLTSTTWAEAYGRFTLAEEYAFVRAHQDDVPDGCTITTLRDVCDRGLLLRNGLPFLRRSHRWADLGDPSPAPACTVYYRSALCLATVEGEPDDLCAAYEASHVLEPIAESEIAARGWLFERYPTDTLRVGYYRVAGPRR